jgi:hypothetical protein
MRRGAEALLMLLTVKGVWSALDNEMERRTNWKKAVDSHQDQGIGIVRNNQLKLDC